MIRVRVEIDLQGLVRSLDMRGHAELAVRGQDVLCSAVSVLVRTFQRIVETESLPSEHGVPERGAFYLKIITVTEAQKPWYTGTGRMLLQGLRDLEEEFPQAVSLELVPWGGK